MKFGLDFITKLANGELTVDAAMNNMLLPAMKKAGNKTLIIQLIKDEKGKEKLTAAFDKRELKDWFDDKTKPMKDLLLQKTREIDALADEHKLLIEKYNSLVKSKK